MPDAPHATDASLRIWPEDWLHPLPLRRWFDTERPLAIDVGCGKGRFLLARAAAHPDINFLGMDRMLRRIRKVDNKARRAGLRNVRLLRMEAYYGVTYLVPPASVAVYYIFHPDPWPKKRHHTQRLFSPPFMDALFRTLQPGGDIHISTDHAPYHEAIRELFREDARFESIPPFVPSPEERTDFELYYLGRTPIGRCSFRKPAVVTESRSGSDGDR